ncbi:hypothetical protein O6P32_12465 [Phocaeicola sp. KGMB11183]|uniref:EpsG family protein n=1 Tax=Phocaeicola acetigenes TaxID=3016083 RepID=A0ABT4PKC8_9BACT|nr:hypothetical protein [Phocaeicola sp. KGMB11183]MCZ8373510.1 hypothetical protein [Phocaeicola sp. KGMB11183]
MKYLVFTKDRLFSLVFYSYCLLLVFELILRFVKSVSPVAYLGGFLDFSISDWLINYEAGFVRRGLWGQLFFYLYDCWGINVGYLVYTLSYIFLFLFLYIFLREWKRNNLSLFLLPSVCLIGAFAMSDLRWYRRDILIFLFIWYIFICYRSFLKGSKIHLILLYILSAVAILSHEASFFYFLPILGLHYFLFVKKENNLLASIVKASLFMLPGLLVMFICVIYKGDGTMADSIWHSWDNYFISEFGSIFPMGAGCRALGWDGMDTFKMHLNGNYMDKTLGVYRFCIWPFIFIAIYYLLIQLNKVKIGVKNSIIEDKLFMMNLSNVLVLQFIFLLPMFTVLSCDFRRVILYWTISSFLFCFALRSNCLKLLNVKVFSNKLQTFNRVLTSGILGKKSFYIIVFCFLGVPSYGFSYMNAFISSVLGNIWYALSYTISYIYGA